MNSRSFGFVFGVGLGVRVAGVWVPERVPAALFVIGVLGTGEGDLTTGFQSLRRASSTRPSARLTSSSSV